MFVAKQRLHRSAPLERVERRDQPHIPWLIIGIAFAVTVAIIVLKEAGASDADTDYASMSILIAALAFASTLNRRTGLMVAILAGVVAAIVPGTATFTRVSPWDTLFRLCFLIGMSVSFYRVIVALRQREDHLQRQLQNVQLLQEEVTALHALTVHSPINRDTVYTQIVRGALRLGSGVRSRLALQDPDQEGWDVVAQWPPHPSPPAEVDVIPRLSANSQPYTLAQGPDGTQRVIVPLLTGNQISGVLQIECGAESRDLSEHAQLLAIYARDATLTLEHIALQQQLEHFAVMGERGRIARDLHDGLVQSLAGIAFHLEYYRDQLGPEATAVRAGFDGMASAVKEALHEARSMIHELRREPSPENLADVLHDLVDRAAAKTSLSIVATITDESLPVSRAQAGVLLRIAQEALQNVIKHARATQVRLTLIRAQDAVTLRMRDDGRGFSPANPTAEVRDDAAHFGLVGMAERAAMHGGELTIDSAPGNGTTITLVFPVSDAEGQ